MTTRWNNGRKNAAAHMPCQALGSGPAGQVRAPRRIDVIAAGAFSGPYRLAKGYAISVWESWQERPQRDISSGDANVLSGLIQRITQNMRWSNRFSGTGLLCVSALLLLVVYYFAFREGCIGGIEAMPVSNRDFLLSLGTIAASFASAFLGIYILTRRQFKAAFAVFLLVLTFSVPFTLWLSMEGSGHGTRTCHR